MLKIEKGAYKKLASRNLAAPLDASNLLSELFHENTKLGPFSSAAYYRHIANVANSSTLRELLAHPYKIYSLDDSVSLERPRATNAIESGIVRRRSERNFSGQPLSLQIVSRLLYFSYGITDPDRGFRAVPSGGALYPLEVYVFSRHITGLDPGIYHYNVENHGLDVVERGDFWPELESHVGFQYIDVDNAAALVLITAIFRRTTLKYLDRGYRMVLFEAGAAAQNLALTADALGVGSCLLGGFHDNDLASLVGANGVDEAPLIPIVLGARAEESPGEQPQPNPEP